LRHVLRAYGTHVGCEHGVCGACTVMVDGRAVRSCLMFAVQVEGKEVRTIEGLESSGKLNVLQQAFADQFALQCGFCTPGILMSATHFLENNQKPTDEEIKSMLSGHICRCTGYDSIVKAIRQAAKNLESNSKAKWEA
jgi:aerobic-type carbon monoxide dehydrogenase small subunit (CoxS/CutS family)